MTNYGRSALFCPYSISQNHLAAWSVVAAGNKPITGFIVDILSARSTTRLRSIGASISASLGQPKIPILRVMAMETVPPFSYQNTLSYLTTGTLSSIQRLQTRKVGTRCTGLCVYHDDGFIEALGQWDPSDGNTISDIYDRSDGPLAALTFCYAGDDPLSSCISESLVGERLETNQTFVWRASDDQVRSKGV